MGRMDTYEPQTSIDKGATPRPARALVLVVDDEPLMRTVMKRVLVDEGYDVVTAAHPREALELARNGPRPDVVLTDLLMPGMDGVELARRLRDRWPGVAFVFMSAVTDAAQVSRLESRDGGVYLEKPFEI